MLTIIQTDPNTIQESLAFSVKKGRGHFQRAIEEDENKFHLPMTSNQFYQSSKDPPTSIKNL